MDRADKELTGLLDGAADLGDWMAEYRAFGEGCALTLRADRCVVLVSGARRAEMLNGLLSNQVTDLEDAGRHAFLSARRAAAPSGSAT